MDLGNVKALKLAPAVSISDLHFERMENVMVCSVIRDLKSHRRYITGLNASNVANRDVLRRAVGGGEKHENEKKNDDHNRTRDDGLRFHTRSIAVLVERLQGSRGFGRFCPAG